MSGHNEIYEMSLGNFGILQALASKIPKLRLQNTEISQRVS